MAKVRFFKRSGEAVSRAAVERARDSFAEGKRSGRLGLLRCSVQVQVAERVEAMTAEEFCRWSGQFSYRVSR